MPLRWQAEYYRVAMWAQGFLVVDIPAGDRTVVQAASKYALDCYDGNSASLRSFFSLVEAAPHGEHWAILKWIGVQFSRVGALASR